MPRSYRRTATRGRRRSSYRPRRRTSRRKGVRAAQQRIVIQVIGAPGAGVPVSAANLGQKSYRPVRRRF